MPAHGEAHLPPHSAVPSRSSEPSLSYSGPRIGERLRRVEENWFGTEQAGSLQERLERMEVSVFGHANAGSAAARLDQLDAML